jgi:hypothetical protein
MHSTGTAAREANQAAREYDMNHSAYETSRFPSHFPRVTHTRHSAMALANNSVFFDRKTCELAIRESDVSSTISLDLIYLKEQTAPS